MLIFDTGEEFTGFEVGMWILQSGVCDFPERLHPVSAKLLDYFLSGDISAPLFQRFFSLPNSDYIALAACIVKNVSLAG
ncbi:MAG: hypothetical protein QNJ92_03485 [Alphaproteobacteria bacterium]|nr:hypothetical protein [Alphaproteobacteria bacterium]